MPSSTLPTSAVASGDPWLELEKLLQDLAEKSRAVPPLPAALFYQGLLERTVAGLAAAGGIVWRQDADGALHQTASLLPPDLPAAALEFLSPSNARRLDRVNSSSEAIAVPPKLPASGSVAASKLSDGYTNPTPYTLLQAPWIGTGGILGILEILQRTGGSPSTQAGYLHFLSLVCELTGDYERRQALRVLQDENQFQGSLLELTSNVTRSLELVPTACDIVQESRRILGVDRVTLVQLKRRRCRTLAVSGVERVERRSALVRKIENLAELVVQTRKPLWYHDASNGISARILPALQDLIVESGSRRLAILPLIADTKEPGESENSPEEDRPEYVLGALVIEQFQASGTSESLELRCLLVQKVATSLLQGALTHSTMPLRFVSRGVQSILRQLNTTRFPRTFLVLGLCSALILALTFVPAELRIEGRGKLQPKLRRDLFAASDGVVRTVRTRHGADVKEGAVLIELRQSQLEFDTSRVLGEIQTNQQRLAAVQSLRLAATSERGDARDKYAQLASEEEELKAQLKSLGEQRRILEQRQEELSLKSTLNGQVLTWDVEQLLTARPVQRGQVLLTVGDLNGPWEIEVEVPDDQIGHVLEAQRTSRKLPVSFVLASSPGTVHSGAVERIALAAETDEERRPVVVVIVNFDSSAVQPLRPGLAALPRIHCGQRSVGYVWLHRLWEAIQSWMLF